MNDRWFTQQKKRFLQIAEHLGLSGRAFSVLTTRQAVTLNTESFRISVRPGDDNYIATLKDDSETVFTQGELDSGQAYVWCRQHLKKEV